MSNTVYEVGFGKSPKANQFKKGQSGNPKGRPRTKHDMLNDAAAILIEPVQARRPDGRQVPLEAIEAAYLALCRKALNGHSPSLFDAIKIMLESGAQLESESDEKLEVVERICRITERLGVPTPPQVLAYKLAAQERT